MDLNKNQSAEEDTEQLLKENLVLNQENNRLLKSIARSTRWGMVFSSIKWIVVIGSIFGAYYYFEPLFIYSFDQYQKLTKGSSYVSTSTATNIGTMIDGLREKIKGL